ncbi:MAG: response regulator [Thermodesulfobacteriota bacterium]
MARIMVKVSLAEVAEDITRFLLDEKHETLTEPGSVSPVLNPEKLAEEILARKPDLVILDYLAEDALSVKAMQMVRDKMPLIKFIFVLADEPPLAHLVLALNEGAAAFLAPPVARGALDNYVTRALSRQREEKANQEEIERCRRTADEEKACSLEQSLTIAKQTRVLRQYSLLVNHLLAAPPARPDRKVLVVSDSTYQIDLFRRHLEEANFQVLTAKDGQAGLETAHREHPRIIVSDLEMPNLNGLELCRAVKNDKALVPNHFIICTANEKKIEEVLRPEHLVDDCLLKPSRPEDFQEFTARVALGLLV